jgi:hypothetical protein
LNIEFYFSTMNDDRIFFRIIMLILNSNNFHLWIEELKDLILKIKIWEYINSYDKIEESRKEVLSKISHFFVKQSDFASSAVVDDLITDQINQFAQDFTQSRFAKYFHELSIQQQENYRTNVKEYKRKKKQVAKITQKMLKINEAICASIRTYILSKLMFVLIKKILQVLIIKYKKIDDQIKKQIHEKFQALKQSSFKNQIEIWVANWENFRSRIWLSILRIFSISKRCSSRNFWSLIENELQRSAIIELCRKERLKETFISKKRFASIKMLRKRDWKSLNMSMSSLFRINHSFSRKSRRHRSVQISMRIAIKHDNAYANACMIEINVITFVNRLNHRIESAIRKRRNE